MEQQKREKTRLNRNQVVACGNSDTERNHTIRIIYGSLTGLRTQKIIHIETMYVDLAVLALCVLGMIILLQSECYD